MCMWLGEATYDVSCKRQLSAKNSGWIGLHSMACEMQTGREGEEKGGRVLISARADM